MAQVVIGTAGHIDHGKTTLVKALTGTDTDRLAEEKARGMTIDIGFAFLSDDITIIDVPGHEKFIRNMVSGVTTIQIALLVIAADDGIMPQTKEHLQILSLLQISQGVIALTKIDLVDEEWIELVEDDIRKLCKNTFFKDAPIIRTSTANGNGVDELKNTLLKKSEGIRSIRDRSFFRLQVDRSFSKTGFGTVVTGTVISGNLKKGDEIQLLPLDKVGRVRGIQSHGKAVDSVKVGDRAAVNLVGIDKKELWRGVELTSPGWLRSTSRIIANISIVADTNWVIKSKQRIRVHIGTQEVLARITWIKSALKAGNSTNALITFEEPAVAAMDDKFVIRSYSPLNTIGGGIVLDQNPVGNLKQLKEWVGKLSVEETERYLQFIDHSIINPQSLEEWRIKFQIPIEELKAIIKENKLKTTKGKPLIYTEDNLDRSKKILTKILDDFHSGNPTKNTMKGEELKEKSKFSSNWFEFVIEELMKSDIVRNKKFEYSLADYNIELSEEDQNITVAILKIFESYGLEPLTVNVIVQEINQPNKKIVELLHIQKGQEQVIKISDKLWFNITSFNELISRLKKHFENSRELSVVEFKDLTGLTRKTAIPLLEYLDKTNFTARDGNNRLKGKEL
jgi:selenocysteine-specific elongation factor